MQAVRTTNNQYRGINAHLHSLFQTEGGWSSFHSNHIIDLVRALQAQLRPMGYEADVEQSLQIRRADHADIYPESDATIFDPNRDRAFEAAAPLPLGGTGQVTVPIPDLLALSEEQIADYKAIGIYQRAGTADQRGEPIVWIELLSPSNKPPAFDFYVYREKRMVILQNRITFVEIDYLHQSPPTFPRLASYRPRGRDQNPTPDARPYRIVVIHPRPGFLDGHGVLHQFQVDEPIPGVMIPLSGDDRLEFTFNEPYQTSFAAMFYGDRVDYSRLPVNFELYSEADRARIVARMVAVLTAQRAGADLEAAPLPVETLDLATGLARLKVLTG